MHRASSSLDFPNVPSQSEREFHGGMILIKWPSEAFVRTWEFSLDYYFTLLVTLTLVFLELISYSSYSYVFVSKSNIIVKTFSVTFFLSDINYSWISTDMVK